MLPFCAGYGRQQTEYDRALNEDGDRYLAHNHLSSPKRRHGVNPLGTRCRDVTGHQRDRNEQQRNSGEPYLTRILLRMTF